MRKILIFLLSLPFISFGQQQQCDTVFSGNNSVVYCLTDASCHASCDGEITISIFGPDNPYRIVWGASTDTLPNGFILDTLCPGNYSVIVLDGNNNLIDVRSNEIEEPSELSIYTNQIKNPTCFNDIDGFINISTFGDSPFEWDWISTGDITEDISGLDSGIYILETTDNNDCSRIDTFELINPAKIISTITADTLSCIGSCDGDASVVPDLGVPPYTFEWDDPLAQITASADSLCYGLATVFITDDNGCLDTNTVFIENPDTLKLSNITIDSACYQICDGQLSVAIAGGKSPYGTEWSFGGSIFNTTDTITNDTLCPGNYQLIYTDANNCSDTVIIPLIERDSFLVQNWVIDDSCYNSCTGQITVELMNQNNPPLTYDWSNGGNDSVISNLCFGFDTLEIIDDRGCRDTFYYFVDQPDSLYFDSIDITHNLCYGNELGAITIIGFSGGISPITYDWSNGANGPSPGISSLPAAMYSLHIEDANACSIDIANIEVTEPDSLYVFYTPLSASCFGYSDGSISVNLSGGTIPYMINGVTLSANDTTILSLPSGNYLYTVLDSNNCFRPEDTITVEEPDILDIDSVLTHILCHGYHTGEIDLTTVGGTLPYDYQWTGPNGYNSAPSDGDIVNLAEGSYSVTVLDDNDCPLSSTMIITEPVLPLTPSLIIDSIILCHGDNTGDVDLTLIGGTPSYNFAWSNASTNEDLENVGAGNYTVTIIDANGCDTSASINITEPDAITFIEDITDLLCFEDGSGTIDIITQGGSIPYTFLWSSGQTTDDISNLMAGSYLLTVTDDNNCSYSELFTVTEPDLFQTDMMWLTHIDCFGNNNGSIDFQVSGGISNFSYSWDSGQTTSIINNLSPGIYIVTATDANNCQFTDQAEILEPDELVLSLISIAPAVCFGEASGSVDIEASGGVPGYSYSWSNGASNEDLQNVEGGNYDLEVEDANGCDISGNYFIDQPNPYNETVNIADIINLNGCFGDAIGSIDFSIVGNTPPYSYVWTNNETTASISDLLAGTYEVDVMDDNNCLITYSYDVLEPDALTLDYLVTPASCEEKNDGAIYTTASGGTPPYFYNWIGTSIFSAFTQDISYLSVGTYTLEVEDANGCSLPLQSISVPFDGFDGCLEIPSGFTPNGDGIHDEWSVYGLFYFHSAVVKVYNRWGQEVFSSQGYNVPWDGKRGGDDLPTATYYYVIEIPDLDKVFNGTVTIKR